MDLWNLHVLINSWGTESRQKTPVEGNLDLIERNVGVSSNLSHNANFTKTVQGKKILLEILTRNERGKMDCREHQAVQNSVMF